MTLQTRYAELQSTGRLPLYGDGLTIVRPKHAKNLLIKLGYQPSTGRYLYLLDLDSHTASQNAEAARAAFRAALPHIPLAWVPSRGGKGLHALFESYMQLPTGKLFDASGNHIGELIGGEQHTYDHGDLEIPILSQTQIEHLRGFWTIQGGDVGGERWSDRAKQGERWARGYKPRKRADLRAFLTTHGLKTGRDLDALFDERGAFNRSDKAGSLMQNIMLNIHKETKSYDFSLNCRAAMGYWMAAESYGKVGEKDYDQEKDGYSLIAQIVHQDALLSGKHWTCPFWAKSQTAAAPEPESEPPPKRPAHRPIGDREKQIKRLRRLLERRALDYYGKIPYYVDDLAEDLGVSRRSVQNYLEALASGEQPLIERGQDKTGPGGRAWLILLPAFWGAINSPAAAETAQESAQIWGANESAEQRVTVPQNANRASQCKEEDHLNPCTATPSPPKPAGASYTPVELPDKPYTTWRGFYRPRDLERQHRRQGTLTGSDTDWTPSAPIDRAPPARRVRGQAREKGQQSFMGRDGIAARIARRKHHGESPAPTPYRPRAQLVTEDLPEPPAAAAPPGAQGFGAPLPGIAERLHRLKAEREAAHVE